MRPMTESPHLFGIQVELVKATGEIQRGWVTKIPEGGWYDDDRAFAEDRQYATSQLVCPPGYSHGALPWGSRFGGNPPNGRYVGWDYITPLIHEEPDVEELLCAP